MRDQHWEQCQLEGPRAECLPQNLDEDEIQALVFDLVRADKVEVCRSLAPWIRKLGYAVKTALFTLAASSASGAMIDVLMSAFDYTQIECSEINAAIRGRNIETFRHMLRLTNGRAYWRILLEARISRCEEFSLDWELNIDAHRKSFEKSKMTKAPFESLYIEPDFLRSAKGDSENERFIMLVWEKLDLAKTLPKSYLGVALVNVAQTCCSLKLATYLIEAGASVDHRRSPSYLTPLHHATTHNTPEAAELIQYLLSKGADPTARAKSTPGRGSKIRRIEDEAGAKGISKWLEMSWDDLVEKAVLEREKESK
ncbi:hypothetical protein ACEPPN_019074 [Leptodophora sp. 'Broadleaf-Isolate-01']